MNGIEWGGLVPGWAGQVVGCVLLGMSLAACTPSLDWRETRPSDGLTVLFPCRPDTHVRQVAIGDATLPMSLTSCSADDRTFALSHVDVSDISQLAPVLQALQQVFTDKLQSAGTPTRRASASVPGATPHPLAQQVMVEGRRPDGRPFRADSLFFCRGLRVYQATMIGDRPDAQALDTFFSSLKLSN